LHYTAIKGDKTVVDLLIKNQVNLNIIDREGFNALGLALKEEKPSVAYRLLNEDRICLTLGAGPLPNMLFLAVSKLDVIAVDKILNNEPLLY
jgi:ankyrin repeat protein